MQSVVGGCSALRARHSAACAASAARSRSAISRRSAAIEPLLPREALIRPSTAFPTIIIGLRAVMRSSAGSFPPVAAYSTTPSRTGTNSAITGKRGRCSASGSSGVSTVWPA